MKKLIILATVSTLSLGAYAVAQTPAELAAQFQSLQERVHAMSPTERADFKKMMRENMQKGKHCDRGDKRGWWDKARHKMSHVFDKDKEDCQHGGKKHHYGEYCDRK